MTKKTARVPPDCISASRSDAVHWLERKPRVLDESIECGHPVEFQQQWTRVSESVTCWACVQAMLARGIPVRKHKTTANPYAK
jgi:hypothetical protein